jgi:hypothetical protein
MTSLLAQYQEIHAGRVYGNTSVKRAPHILSRVRTLHPRSVIDYGCGQSLLADLIRKAGAGRVVCYDPAIPAYAAQPVERFDLLVNVDVLEHVPACELDAVLSHMASLSNRAIIIIDTRPAKTLLPDGRNAHVTLASPQWWQQKLASFYPTVVRLRSVRRRPASFITWQPSALESATTFCLTNAYRLVERSQAVMRRLETLRQGSSRGRN